MGSVVVFRRGVSLLSVFLCACAASPAPNVPPSPPVGVESRWQVLQRDGQPLGRRQQWHYCAGERCFSSEVTDIAVQQPGAPVSISRVRLDYVESRDAQGLSASKQLRSKAANHRLQLIRQGDGWQLQQAERRNAIRLESAPLFPVALQRSMLENRGQAPLVTREWSFSSLTLETIRYRFTPISQSPLDPERRELLLPWLQQIAWRIDRERQTERGWQWQAEWFSDVNFTPIAERNLSAGSDLWLLPCDERCRDQALQPPQHVYQRLIRSPYRISDEALRGKIRYQLGGVADAELPATGEQQVRRQDDKLLVSICDDCGDESVPERGSLQAAMAANYWLPHHDPAMQRVVEEVLGDAELSPRAAMQRLTRFVTGHMDEVATYSGYGTALDALQSGHGDCTEHALLLAALGRAAGIPSRLVMGLAYNNERFLGRRFVFVPHMWVQAWTGDRWESFDSGLGAFTAGYIALALSAEGDQASFLAMNTLLDTLSIDSAVQLRSRPAEP